MCYNYCYVENVCRKGKRMRDLMIKNRNIILYFAGGIFLYTLFVFCYGIIPGVSFPSLGININIMGTMGDYAGFLKDGILYPYGGLEFEGYGLFVIGEILHMFIPDLEVVTCATYLLVYTISFVSMCILAAKILKYKWLSLGMITVFYFHPFIVNHFGIPYVSFGYLLFPMSILLDITVYNCIVENHGSSKKILKILLLVFGRTFFVSIGWYTAVIGAVLSCLYYLIRVFKQIINRNWYVIRRYLLYCLLPWFIAMVIILVLTPKTAISFGVSLEFLHADSLNLATLFLPGDSQWISNIIPSFQSVLPAGTSLYGDGTMCNNYIGYALLMGIVLLIVFWIKKNTNHKKDIMPLLITGIVGLILAVGPALKFLGFHEGDDLLYEMPFQNSILLPWKFLYLLFPLRTMRAVYRWVMIPQIVVLIVGFYGLKCLWMKRKKVRFGAIFLCLLAIVEMYPSNGIIGLAQKRIDFHNQINSFYQDVIEPMKKTVQKGDIVSFAEKGAKNSFLLPYIMTELQATAYQGCGDKALAVAANYTPKDITNLQNATEAQQISYYICEVLNKGLCDKVVIPYFDCRQDSYSWNRNNNGGKTYKLIAKKSVEYLSCEYEVIEEEFFLIVYKKEKVNGYQLLNDEEIEKEKNNNSLFHHAKCLSLQAASDIDIEIPVDQTHTKLYLAMYGKSSSENGQVLCKINEYGKNEKLIKTEEVVFRQLGEYYCREEELILQKNVSKIIVMIEPELDTKIKNFFVTPYAYAIEQLKKQKNRNGDDIVLLDKVTSFNGVKEGDKISDISPGDIEKMNIKFDMLWKESKDTVFLSKMQHWNDTMSFDILYKEGYYTFAFTENGYENENIYIKEEQVKKNIWNSFEIDFDNSDLTIAVNNKVIINKKLNIKKIYSSPQPIEIGTGFVGKMRNVSIKYN